MEWRGEATALAQQPRMGARTAAGAEGRPEFRPPRNSNTCDGWDTGAEDKEVARMTETGQATVPPCTKGLQARPKGSATQGGAEERRRSYHSTQH